MDRVKIGDQIWSSKNSTLKKFNNGLDIYHCKTKEEWNECGLIERPSYCYYDFDEKNEQFGLLYNGYVLISSMWDDYPRELSQDGFGVPTLEDWNQLEEFIGGKDKVNYIKSNLGWGNAETDKNELNTSLELKDPFGFNCLPSGWVNDQGEFYQLGTISKLWSFTQIKDGSGKLWSRIVGFKFTSSLNKPENGFSIRLIKK
jgi:uncharacterized protein (TIGR02145 family)